MGRSRELVIKAQEIHDLLLEWEVNKKKLIVFFFGNVKCNIEVTPVDVTNSIGFYFGEFEENEFSIDEGKITQIEKEYNEMDDMIEYNIECEGGNEIVLSFTNFKGDNDYE